MTPPPRAGVFGIWSLCVTLGSISMTHQQIVTFLRRVTLVGVYGGLLMPLVFIPIVIFPFVFSKLIAFQILIGLTFPAYLALAWIEPKHRPQKHVLFLAILSYFVAVACSVVFAVDPLRAWWGNQERMNGLFTLLHFLAWLMMAVGVVKTWEQWKKVLNYEVVLSGIMAIVALLQKVNPKLLLFPAGPRVGGLLDNPIYMGAYQIFNLYFLALLFIKTRSTSLRVWYGFLALLDIGAFIAAQSRGNLVGLGAGIIVFALFYALFTKSKKYKYLVLGSAATVFVLYGILFAFRNTPFVQQSSFARLTSFSTTIDTRFIAWHIAWDGFRERPLTGWGFDNFHILFNLKYNPYSLRYSAYETWFDRAHNTVLDVLSMTGILGFITFFAIFGTLFFSVWRAFRRQWIDLSTASILISLPVAYFVQNLFVFDHPAAFSMSFLLYAFVIAATRQGFMNSVPDASESVKGVAQKHDFSWTTFTIVQLVFVLIVWRTSVLPFHTSRLALLSNGQFGTVQGLAYAKQAAAIWTPYLDEQTFLLSRNIITISSQGNLSKISQPDAYIALTKQLVVEELRRHPRNTNTLFVYARMLQELAGSNQAKLAEVEKVYQDTIATSPKRQQLYFALARLYISENRLSDALETYKKVRDFDPELGQGHWMYGLSLYYDKQDRLAGAKELAESQTVTYPYAFTDAREFMAVADAYQLLNDKEGMKKLIARLPDVPLGEAATYAQLAHRYELMSMPTERDQVLSFAEQNGLDARQILSQLQSNGVQFKAPATTVSSPSSTSVVLPVATNTAPARGPRR